ncbi:MAG: 1-acyl-sn-glycerol-3-phosphate acyltransferase [Planctomycetaceae bacterium]|nr:MAG: 1-acyl-sn-glycerol-3-phosphate acyltransferase [Planctomycetaceae bacterium]
MSERSLSKRTSYAVLQVLAQGLGILLFSIRFLGREHIPVEGGVLVCSNHQSFFDPVLVGMGFRRRLNYLARKTLFRFYVFRWLIEFLDAIPIDREGGGLGGLKETLKRLKRGELVLIFPEGTRTRDGEVAALKPGFVALARRSKTPLLPVAVDGAYDAWPREAKFPRRSRVSVSIGPPMMPEYVRTLTDEQLVAELERRIRHCHAVARRMCRR